MKILLLYDYPPPPAGLSTQGDLLYRGLLEMGVEARAVHFESAFEKEWYYRWFKPDLVVGVGYWGYTPHLILHPQEHGVQPVPWLVADGYIAKYQDVLNSLPLILVTSRWVKDVYIRDGIKGDNIEVLPVGCDTDQFFPLEEDHPKVQAVRDELGIERDELMILTVGGDATSKGAQEIMHALARIQNKVPAWKYVCKVWPQQRTALQNPIDLQLAQQLGIEKNVRFVTSITSRNFMPYLLGACDIYAAPSRLEGFGMSQIEAGACARPVIGIRAMGMLDTLIHCQTAFLADVAQEVVLHETIVEDDLGGAHKIVFNPARIAEYRASVDDLSNYLFSLMTDPGLRETMGHALREHVVQNLDYRVVARRFVQIVGDKLGIA
ncbi:MAG: glycosyltransferase family 4 protein [Bacteroidota bacterium]